jgi:hypothetical protein
MEHGKGRRKSRTAEQRSAAETRPVAMQQSNTRLKKKRMAQFCLAIALVVLRFLVAHHSVIDFFHVECSLSLWCLLSNRHSVTCSRPSHLSSCPTIPQNSRQNLASFLRRCRHLRLVIGGVCVHSKLQSHQCHTPRA